MFSKEPFREQGAGQGRAGAGAGQGGAGIGAGLKTGGRGGARAGLKAEGQGRGSRQGRGGARAGLKTGQGQGPGRGRGGARRRVACRSPLSQPWLSRPAAPEAGADFTQLVRPSVSAAARRTPGSQASLGEAAPSAEGRKLPRAQVSAQLCSGARNSRVVAPARPSGLCSAGSAHRLLHPQPLAAPGLPLAAPRLPPPGNRLPRFHPPLEGR